MRKLAHIVLVLSALSAGIQSQVTPTASADAPDLPLLGDQGVSWESSVGELEQLFKDDPYRATREDPVSKIWTVVSRGTLKGERSECAYNFSREKKLYYLYCYLSDPEPSCDRAKRWFAQIQGDLEKRFGPRPAYQSGTIESCTKTLEWKSEGVDAAIRMTEFATFPARITLIVSFGLEARKKAELERIRIQESNRMSERLERTKRKHGLK